MVASSLLPLLIALLICCKILLSEDLHSFVMVSMSRIFLIRLSSSAVDMSTVWLLLLLLLSAPILLFCGSY